MVLTIVIQSLLFRDSSPNPNPDDSLLESPTTFLSLIINHKTHHVNKALT